MGSWEDTLLHKTSRLKTLSLLVSFVVVSLSAKYCLPVTELANFLFVVFSTWTIGRKPHGILTFVK